MFPENIDLYIENLHFNGIIIFEHENYSTSDSEYYENLVDKVYRQEYIDLEKIIGENNSNYKLEVQIRKGYIEFSELGKKFIAACVKDLV